jgi:hypothetical protein
MAAVLWMNIPLMVLAFGLMAGIPLWMVLRRQEWHGKQETRAVPAYIVRQRREATAQRQRQLRDRRQVRPVTGGANW